MTPQQLKDQILPIIRSVRSVLLPYYGNIEVEGEKSNAHDLVTRLDRETEKYLCEEFKKIDPTIGFVGEEFGGDRDAKKFGLSILSMGRFTLRAVSRFARRWSH